MIYTMYTMLKRPGISIMFIPFSNLVLRGATLMSCNAGGRLVAIPAPGAEGPAPPGSPAQSFSQSCSSLDHHLYHPWIKMCQTSETSTPTWDPTTRGSRIISEPTVRKTSCSRLMGGLKLSILAAEQKHLQIKTQLNVLDNSKTTQLRSNYTINKTLLY